MGVRNKEEILEAIKQEQESRQMMKQFHFLKMLVTRSLTQKQGQMVTVRTGKQNMKKTINRGESVIRTVFSVKNQSQNLNQSQNQSQK